MSIHSRRHSSELPTVAAIPHEIELSTVHQQTEDDTKAVETVAETQLPPSRHPQNWTATRKWTTLILMSFFTLMAPMASSMVAPALATIAEDFSIISDFERQLILAIFVLCYGITPVVVGPLCEQYGRIPVLQVGNVLFAIFNAACGASRTPTQLTAFRALSGLAGGTPVAIGAGMLKDLYTAENRGKAVSIYNVAPLLSPALGPIIGAVITERVSWPWIFYIMSIIDAAVLIVSFFVLRETYAPVLLERWQQEARLEANVESAQRPRRSISAMLSKLAGNLRRPIHMLVTDPLIQLLSLFVAYQYGVIYLVLSTFADLWTVRYHQSVSVSGLNFLALGIGYLLGSQICGLTMDSVYKRLARKEDGAGRPEFRLPLAGVGTLLGTAGLLIYAWTAQYTLMWILPDLGVLVFAVGAIVGTQSIFNYVIDAYGRYTASATGAITLLRGLLGFALPLVAPYMYARLDYGWGNTLLALFQLVIGASATLIFWTYGARLRTQCRYCVE